MELRIPQQLSFEAFRAFNQPYAEQSMKWKLVLGRYSAVCRTNVVPAKDVSHGARGARILLLRTVERRRHLLRVGHRRH